MLANHIETKDMNELTYPYTLNHLLIIDGVVGCGKGVMYLTSPGRPTDIDLRLGKACYPCSR